MLVIEINCKNYTNFERIGIGSYGNIYKAQNKTTNSYVIWKNLLINYNIVLVFLNKMVCLYHFIL